MRTIGHAPPGAIERLQHSWRQLRNAEPGERFKERFQRKQRQRRDTPLRKPLYIGAGVLILIAGVVLLPAPGPGLLVLLLGAGIIAQESHFAAAILDRAELYARRLLAWTARIWARLPKPVKSLLLLAAFALAVSLAWAGYRLLAGE